jgi:hypothetical protein
MDLSLYVVCGLYVLRTRWLCPKASGFLLWKGLNRHWFYKSKVKVTNLIVVLLILLVILMTAVFVIRFIEPGKPEQPTVGMITDSLVSGLETSGKNLLVYENTIDMRTSDYTGYFIVRNSKPAEQRFNISFICSDCGHPIVGGQGVGLSPEWIKSFSFTTIKAGEHRVYPFKVMKPPARRGTYHLTLLVSIGSETYAESPIEILIT